MCSSGPSRYSPQRRDSRIPREGLSNRCSVCRSLHKLFRSNDENFDRISTCLEVVIPQASRRSIISCQTLTEIRARGQYKAEVAGRGGRRGRCEGRWVSVRKNAIEVMGQPKGYVLLKTLEFNRHPDVFSAAVLPNPVISACELCTSDISDRPSACQ